VGVRHDDGERLFLDHLEVIEKIIRFTTRRNGLSTEDAEELAGHVRLKLIEDDYALLRKFEGRSKFTTYLTTVIQRLFLDWRIARWGKWRPSAEAKRLGPTAILLEQLVHRDGYTFDEAVSVLRTSHGVDDDRDRLYAMLLGFPERMARPGKRQVDPDSVTIAAKGSPVEELEERESGERGRELARALGESLAALPARERVVVRMRYLDGFSVPEIARTLGINHKSLYRDIDRIGAVLRDALLARGFDRAEARELLERRVPTLDLGANGDFRQPGPSQRDEGGPVGVERTR